MGKLGKLFTCWYCANHKPIKESSDEHIIPSCIGGNRNITLVNTVCKDCNGFMSQYVDTPFCRSFIIESKRTIGKLRHRGKEPIINFGTIQWDRPERVDVFLLSKGENIFFFKNTKDKCPRVAVLADPKMPGDTAIRIQNVLKHRFKNVPCINCKGYVRTEYDAELLQAIANLDKGVKVRRPMNITAWDREIVKMALGLSCLTFRGEYITSVQAQLLREFLFEHNPERRSAMQLHGRMAFDYTDVNPATQLLLKGKSYHLFAIIDIRKELVFIANLFGKYENTVVIDPERSFLKSLPGYEEGRGICWIVDPWIKSTKQMLWMDYIQEIISQNNPCS